MNLQIQPAHPSKRIFGSGHSLEGAHSRRTLIEWNDDVLDEMVHLISVAPGVPKE